MKTNKNVCRLAPFSDKAWDDVFGEENNKNIMWPLRQGKYGMVFPYKPNVVQSGNANYDQWAFSHTNYEYNSWKNSNLNDIQIDGVFTAQTEDDARYMLAVMQFFKSATKGYFGNERTDRNKKGTPPPVLKFNYLGDHVFNNVPVIIKQYSFTMDNTVDYVPVIVQGNIRNSTSYVPVQMSIATTLAVQPNPNKVKNEFSLTKFRKGDMIDKGYI